MKRINVMPTAFAGMIAGFLFGTVNGQVGFEPGAGLPLQTRAESPWFTHPDVRQQLGMSAEQYDSLNERYGRLWKRYNKEYKYFGTAVTEKEIRQRAQIYPAFDREFNRNLDEVLTDRMTRRRYDQLYLQYQGFGAFDDPAVQAELALSADQRAILRQYHREWYDQLARLKVKYAKDPALANDEIREARQRILAKVDVTLTTAQQRKWREITGEPYEFPAAIYFP